MKHHNQGRYQGKFEAHTPKRVRAHRQRKPVTLLVSLLLLLGIAIGSTVAFLATRTAAKKNTFTPSKVSSQVTESFDGTTKSNVAVKNTGDIDAYLRATVNITWRKDQNTADQTVTAKVPQEGVDYTITYSAGTGWAKGEDGYWYYLTPVAPGESTGNLIESCKLLPGAKVPTGYHLSVEIIASAIQSVPAKAVGEAWGVTITENGVTPYPAGGGR